MTVCPDCSTRLRDRARFCSECGRMLNTAAANTANANGAGGFALAGNNAQVNITHHGTSGDTRPRAEMSRKDCRVSGWLELTAAVLTLAAAGVSVVAGWIEKFESTGWVITFAAAVLLAVAAGFIAFHFVCARLTGRSVVRIGGWFLGVVLRHESPRYLTWSWPRAQCPDCPTHKAGIMRPQVEGDDYVWVCNANARQHRIPVDWSHV